jgi:hypothetical protein
VKKRLGPEWVTNSSSRRKTIEKGKVCNFLAFSLPTCSKIAFENRETLTSLHRKALLEADRGSIGKGFRKTAVNRSFTLNMAGSE